jgi:hypothetical protein
MAMDILGKCNEFACKNIDHKADDSRKKESETIISTAPDVFLKSPFVSHVAYLMSPNNSFTHSWS